MPVSTDTQTNSDGVLRRAQGKIVTTAATAAAHSITLGFVPKYFRIINLTDRIVDEWFEGMASASSLHAVAAGTLTLETTNGVAVDENVVTLTATTMVASKTFYWEAIG